MGEFGAVSVVSGHIRGQTNTMPLHVRFSTTNTSRRRLRRASLLALLALVTLVIKTVADGVPSSSARPLPSCRR
jgi:ABC-type sulfate transport system permease subunit